MSKLKILSLFSGIGAPEKALENLGIEYDLKGFSEIDKYAIDSYCEIHNVDKNLNLGDITEINEKTILDFDIMFYGFPCQSYSLAGKKLGTDDPRGVLFYDALRIIREKQPRYAIAENVKNLTGTKFKEIFKDMLSELDFAGYNNYWTILNTRDFGIPQNRERVFIVSIRKDIEQNFEFPIGADTTAVLKEVLEGALSKCKVILEIDAELPILHNVYGGFGEKKPRIFNKYSPTIRTSSGGGHIPSVCTTDKDKIEKEIAGYVIRKLTPKECWRLQGFDDKDIEKCINIGMSNTQLYKQAGNSITVKVLEEIFRNLLKEGLSLNK